MSVKALTSAMALRSVSPSEKLLLLALSNYADEHNRCYPSQRRLAEDTCLSDRTIRTLLAGLEHRGFISRTQRERPDGSRATDIVTLHFDAAGVPEATSGGGETTSGGVPETVSGGVGKPLPGGGEMASALTTFEPSSNRQLNQGVEAQAPAPKADKNGHRLPECWNPNPFEIDGTAWMSADQRQCELDKFRDYWRAVPGAKGRKLDWDATWRNWLRKAAEMKPQPRKANDPRPDAKQLAREANYASAYAGAEIAARRRHE